LKDRLGDTDNELNHLRLTEKTNSEEIEDLRNQLKDYEEYKRKTKDLLREASSETEMFMKSYSALEKDMIDSKTMNDVQKAKILSLFIEIGEFSEKMIS